MFRLWGKIIEDNELREDHVFELESNIESKEKLKQGLEALCYHFDIGRPMWLSDNYKEFGQLGKTSFYEHHFVESISFDRFEIEIIEDK